jgi:hypothetical protein
MKHEPFQSVFRPDFEVVEERQGKVHLYPHTEQLPLLWRALNLEFYGALPDRIARTDKRGNGFHKNLLKHAGMAFCGIFNCARPDGLLLHSMPDADLVTRLVVVQQVTKATAHGVRHRFKFYGGAAFQPEVRLAGRPLVFSQHVIERFSARVPNQAGSHLAMLLLTFFGSPIIALPVGPSLSFILPYQDSILAFPFVLEDGEIVITTCLTIHEMNSLERQLPPLVFNVHYGTAFAVPRIRHWFPVQQVINLYAIWERKIPPPSSVRALPPGLRWHQAAHLLQDVETAKGHGAGTTFSFFDHVPGPYAVEYAPRGPEPHLDERKICRELYPQRDWDKIFDLRDEYILNFENKETRAA